VAVHYGGIEVAHQRLDMVIDDRVVIEIKASENLHADALDNYSTICARLGWR
jgi:hypothetical protein